ncbi:MAG: polysaccharide deacetylase family protein [Desulfuromonadaceae bacterium]
MLEVQTSQNHGNVLDYVFGIVLGEFLGLEWRHETADVDSIRIRLAGHPSEIRMPNVFFGHSETQWLSESTLPSQPLAYWDTRDMSLDILSVNPVVPVIYGQVEPSACVQDHCVDLPIDIFGSAFFMLTRYEESVLPDRDNHDRFLTKVSLAFKEGFLNRPIIDEYVEILWTAMQRLWPQLKRKSRKRVLRVTCDVDSPYQVDYSPYAMTHGLAADLLKRKSPHIALSNLQTRWRARIGNFTGDQHIENIDWMMDVNEQAGNRVAFYFITDHTHPQYDPNYRMDEPVIRKLLRRIHDRGHEIGLHPSYNTYLSPEQTMREANILRSTLEDEGITYNELGGRQHYLRWHNTQTARNLEAAGIAYDSTLCYAECPGFRCGTSREFTMYDIGERRPMALKQRPLVLMETSVFADNYLGLGYTADTLDQMLNLKQHALSVGGEFVLLWHNSSFDESAAKTFYCDLIKH